MEIVLVVAIVAVAATGLYVAATFNERTRQTTAPVIENAVRDIFEHIRATADDLRRQLQLIADDLHQEQEQQRLDGRKIQTRLDQADSQISNLANRFLTEFDASRRRDEQIGAQQDQLSGDLRQLAARLGRERESLPASAGRPAAAPGRLYAERLQFSTVRFASDRGVRIVVERSAGQLPLEQLRGLGDASTIISRAENDPGFRGRLGEAAAGYFATKLGDPAFAAVTERWMTQNAFSETAAAEACKRIGNGLDAILTTQFEAIGTAIRLPEPVPATGAGTGADLVLQPVTRPLAEAARFLEITGVVVGVATGLRPLAMAAGKMLAHDEVHSALARGITEGARAVLAGPQPAAPHVQPAVVRDGPGQSPAKRPTITAAPDRLLQPVQDPGRASVDDPDERHGPSIKGPGLL
jgi:hypothetical protein